MADLLQASRVCFESAVTLCERRVHGPDKFLHADVPALLGAVFDADFHRLSSEQVSVSILPCRRPARGVDGSGLFDDELLDLDMEPGRACKGGACCDSCARIVLDEFASAEECDQLLSACASLMPSQRNLEGTLTLDQSAEARNVRATLHLLRLVERMRRVIAREFALPLEALSPDSAFVSRIPCDAERESYGRLHADESSNDSFHYSAVAYLSTQGESFDGGDFVFSDPAGEREACSSSSPAPADPLQACAVEGSRRLTRLAPSQGRAVCFSSGWENLHYVDQVSKGTRVSVPMFFTTHPRGGGGDGYVAHLLSHWR
eukprot:5758602-Prymnesium_polylepis.1